MAAAKPYATAESVSRIAASLAPRTSIRSNRASASILRPGPPSAFIHVVDTSRLGWFREFRRVLPRPTATVVKPEAQAARSEQLAGADTHPLSFEAYGLIRGWAILVLELTGTRTRAVMTHPGLKPTPSRPRCGSRVRSGEEMAAARASV